MAEDNDNLNIFSIGIPSDKTFEECIDEGMTFKEANEAMKTKFVEVNVPNQYEYDWDTMVNLQREEWERVQELKENYKGTELEIDIQKEIKRYEDSMKW